MHKSKSKMLIDLFSNYRLAVYAIINSNSDIITAIIIIVIVIIIIIRL